MSTTPVPKPAERLPVVLVLDNVRSLHNVGSMFRTADAVRLERILLCGLTPTPPRHEIDKTALGAVATVPWEYCRSTAAALSRLAQDGIPAIALEQTSRSVSLYEASVPGRLALVVGHERAGVSAEALSLCPLHVHLPMLGESARSLNVANAAAVALYELRRLIS